MDFDQIPVGDFDAPSDSPTSGIRGLVGLVGEREWIQVKWIIVSKIILVQRFLFFDQVIFFLKKSKNSKLMPLLKL
jgi:hypothetical protein